MTRIRSTEEFKTVVDTLCLDLADANDHYALHRKLLAAKEGAYTKALSQSQTFWSLTYGAHFDAAVFRLCRAYDQNPTNLALVGLLEAIDSRSPFLPQPAGFNTLDLSQLANDMNWVREESNSVVRHLMMWRHKVYAHRDVRKTIGRDLAETHPVTHADVTALLERGFEIVNRYNRVLFANSFSREVTGLADYEKVLRTLQDRVELREAQFQAEVERAKREANG
jgi:AbiU2